MKIRNISESFLAVNQITTWLQKEVFDESSYMEIENVIDALEDYMGMPLPAKVFIESKL